MSAPAICRCLSTASRAMKRCMISEEPSKMRLMRRSRIARSTPDRRLAAGGERALLLVAAAAADLHRLVDDPPAP